MAEDFPLLANNITSQWYSSKCIVLLPENTHNVYYAYFYTQVSLYMFVQCPANSNGPVRGGGRASILPIFSSEPLPQCLAGKSLSTSKNFTISNLHTYYLRILNTKVCAKSSYFTMTKIIWIIKKIIKKGSESGA